MDQSIDEGIACIDSLPDELLLNIFSYLSISDLFKCAQVSRRWNRISYDERLWVSIRDADSTKWVGVCKDIIPLMTEPNDKKSICRYLRPLKTFDEYEFKKGFFNNCKFFLSQFIFGNRMKIAVVGPGIDNKETGAFFRGIFHNNCSDFEPIQIHEFEDQLNSGITMKLVSPTKYTHKFNMYLRTSKRMVQSSFSHTDQLGRLRYSLLFKELNSNETMSNLSLSGEGSIFLESLSGLIYSIENYNKNEDHHDLIVEFEVLMKGLNSKAPIIILIINKKTPIESVSTFEVAEKFQLQKLNRPWCVIKANVKETHVMKFAVLWLINFYM